MVAPVDVTGRRFGELTALELLPERRAKSRVWRCVCDCGREALRTTESLLLTERKGGQSCCVVCLRELNRGRVLARREERRAGLRALWEAEHTLYGAGWEKATREMLWADLEAAFGPADPDAALFHPPVTLAPDMWGTYGMTPADMAELHRANAARAWAARNRDWALRAAAAREGEEAAVQTLWDRFFESQSAHESPPVEQAP